MVFGRIGRFQKRVKSQVFFTLLLLLCAELAHSACSSPAGIAGDQVYDSNTNVMVFCNGTNWVSMAAGSSGGGQSTTIPGGGSTYVQYNNNGAFSGDSGLTYLGGLLTATNISTTNLTASGNVTAAAFYGDGSHLTGISAAQGDRIISGTTSMVANGATSILNITNGGVTTGYFNSNGVLTVPGISATTNQSSFTTIYASGNSNLAAVSASNVSATGNISAVKFIGDGSLLTGISGGSTSATTAVAFSVNKGGTSQALTISTTTKLTWSTKAFDTNNNFDTTTSRFTPTIAGKYLVTLQVGCYAISGGNTYTTGFLQACNAYIYKNGTAVASFIDGTDTSDGDHLRGGVTALVDMNGTTDYIEAYGLVTPYSGGATGQIEGVASSSYFQGALIGPGQVTSGTTSSGDRIISGTTSIVANSATSIISITSGGVTAGYFNSNGVLTLPGISATSNLTSVTSLYASGNVGIGTTTPAYPLDVNGSGIRSTASGSGYSVLQPGSWAATGFVGFYSSATTRLGYVGWGIPNSTLSLVTDASTTSLSLGTSGTTQMLINGSGNVGVGTMSPNAKLEVAGTVSASAISVPGTSCGVRQVAGFCVNASTPNYFGANIPCNGTTITATCAYNSDVAAYYHSGVNCPSGYTGILLTSFIPAAYAAGYGSGYSLECIKN